MTTTKFPRPGRDGVNEMFRYYFSTCSRFSIVSMEKNFLYWKTIFPIPNSFGDSSGHSLGGFHWERDPFGYFQNMGYPKGCNALESHLSATGGFLPTMGFRITERMVVLPFWTTLKAGQRISPTLQRFSGKKWTFIYPLIHKINRTHEKLPRNFLHTR